MTEEELQQLARRALSPDVDPAAFRAAVEPRLVGAPGRSKIWWLAAAALLVAIAAANRRSAPTPEEAPEVPRPAPVVVVERSEPLTPASLAYVAAPAKRTPAARIIESDDLIGIEFTQDGGEK